MHHVCVPTLTASMVCAALPLLLLLQLIMLMNGPNRITIFNFHFKSQRLSHSCLWTSFAVWKPIARVFAGEKKVAQIATAHPKLFSPPSKGEAAQSSRKSPNHWLWSIHAICVPEKETSTIALRWYFTVHPKPNTWPQWGEQFPQYLMASTMPVCLRFIFLSV